MNAGKTIGRLRALKKAVLADGKVDWDETEQLLAVIRPLAKRQGFLFQDYERLLEKCREDGQITKEESEKLALQLDFLCSFCSNLRLKFWLIVTAVLLLIVATLAVGSRVTDSMAAFGRPAVEVPAEAWGHLDARDKSSRKSDRISHRVCKHGAKFAFSGGRGN